MHGAEQNDYNYFMGNVKRNWKAWEYVTQENALVGGFVAVSEDGAQGEEDYLANNPDVEVRIDPTEVQLDVYLTADFALEHRVKAPTLPLNTRHSLRSVVMEGGKTYSFLAIFAADREAAGRKSWEMRENLKMLIAAQFERYKEVAQRSPRLISPYPSLNAFMSLVPLYHESLKITDHPGAVRAKTTHYGVWAGMVLLRMPAPLIGAMQSICATCCAFMSRPRIPNWGLVTRFITI